MNGKGINMGAIIERFLYDLESSEEHLVIVGKTCVRGGGLLRILHCIIY